MSQLLVLAPIKPVLLMETADQIESKREYTIASLRIDTKCAVEHCAVTNSSFRFFTWREHTATNCPVQVSRVTRSRRAPYGGLTRLAILCEILTSLTSSSAVLGPEVAKCLTMRCLDKCSSNSFSCHLVPDTTKSSPCLNTDIPDSLDRYRQSENVEKIIAIMSFPLATSMHSASSLGLSRVLAIRPCID